MFFTARDKSMFFTARDKSMFFTARDKSMFRTQKQVQRKNQSAWMRLAYIHGAANSLSREGNENMNHANMPEQHEEKSNRARAHELEWGVIV
jgi:hypothetical protein